MVMEGIKRDRAITALRHVSHVVHVPLHIAGYTMCNKGKLFTRGFDDIRKNGTERIAS